MTETFIKTGLIGHPVGHSLSPVIHGYWIEKYGLTGSYEPLDVLPEDLPARLPVLLEQGYSGFNLTLPHKELVLPLCDSMDDVARHIGAVNTLVYQDGQLHGSNSDMFGYIEDIKTQHPAFDFDAAPCVVLGAGGASRAIIAGLMLEGASEIRVINRTREKAEKLAADFGDTLKVYDWDDRDNCFEGAGLLVNATSLGMSGKPPLEITLESLPETALVSDIVYNPLYTDLLRAAQRRGNPVNTGIGMLLHQARPGFELWHGVLPDIDEGLLSLVGEKLGEDISAIGGAG